MRGASARTVTVSAIAAGASSKSTTRVALSVTGMASRTTVLKPRERGRHVVAAQREKRQSVEAGLVGHRFAGRARFRRCAR